MLRLLHGLYGCGQTTAGHIGGTSGDRPCIKTENIGNSVRIPVRIRGKCVIMKNS